MCRYRRCSGRRDSSLQSVGFPARASIGIENRKEGNLSGIPEVGKINDDIGHNKRASALHQTNIELKQLMYI